MLLFWKVYFICLGIALFFSLLTMALFEQADGDPIPVPYAILAICVCAIPGLGMLATLLLVIGIVTIVGGGELLPKNFDNNDNKRQ